MLFLFVFVLINVFILVFVSVNFLVNLNFLSLFLYFFRVVDFCVLVVVNFSLVFNFVIFVVMVDFCGNEEVIDGFFDLWFCEIWFECFEVWEWLFLVFCFIFNNLLFILCNVSECLCLRELNFVNIFFLLLKFFFSDLYNCLFVVFRIFIFVLRNDCLFFKIFMFDELIIIFEILFICFF